VSNASVSITRRIKKQFPLFPQIGKVESAMKSCDMRDLLAATEREVQVINVKMN
jgi:hypothetical protein